MNKELSVIIVLQVFLFSLFPVAAKSRQFPQKTKTITIVCPQAAGGGTDAIVRELMSAMVKDTSLRVVVKNIAGNGTALGTDYVIGQPADGYTLLVGGTFTVSATLQGLTPGYTQLEMIAGLNEDPFIIGVKKGSPYTSFAELVSYAKKHNSEIVLGNAGVGSANYVAALGVNAALGKPFNNVSFNGGAGIIEAVDKGTCVAGVFSQSEIVSNKDLVPLVILTDGHSTLKELASVPTLSEQGYDIEVPGYSYRAIMVRKGTPQTVKSKLAGICNKAFYSESFQLYQKQNGLIQVYEELDTADKFMKELELEYMNILQEANFRDSSSVTSKEYLQVS